MAGKKELIKIVKVFKDINTHFKKNDNLEKNKYLAIVKKQFRKELRK